jgi:hypothetical protein
MEYSQSTPEGVVNALEIVQSPEFAVAVDAANAELLQFADNSFAVAALMAEYEVNFEELMGGEDYESVAATVQGLLWEVDRDGNVSKAGEFMRIEAAFFVRTTVGFIGGVPKIVQMFEMPQIIDEPGGQVVRGNVYYVEPISLTEFELYLSDDGPVDVFLHELGDEVREELLDPEFLALPLGAQQQRLADIIDRYTEEAGVELTVGQSVTALSPWFIIKFDDMQLPLEDCVADQREMDPAQWVVVDGQYKGLILPELEERDEAFRSVDDFPLTKGMLCLRVENSQTKTVVYAPLNCISHVDVDGSFEIV